ncbi:unnamed protein product [Meloidogyne enterolobii]|uniref:Uncharacterized protein n=1 Tax=Meloidogyne enterolobii TaxID=390850 RepID=A0ACB1AKD0_MELEN
MANKKARKARKTKKNLIEENDKNDSPKSSGTSSLKSLNTEVGNNEGKNKEQMEPPKTFTELLNENDDDKEAEHLPDNRNKLDLEGRTGWISPESSSRQANDNIDKDAEPTPEDVRKVISPEGDVDLAFEAHKAQILEELFRDDNNHKEAEHIPEPAQENSKGVEVVDLTSVPSPSNQSPNHLPDNTTNGAFYFYQKFSVRMGKER